VIHTSKSTTPQAFFSFFSLIGNRFHGWFI